MITQHVQSSEMSSHLAAARLGDDGMFVYFVADPHCDVIRIGFTGKEDPASRIADHERYGYKPVAILPATGQHEKLLHDHFAYCKKEDRGTDQSTYRHRDVFPYVTRLLEYHYAAPTLADALQLSRVDWKLWAPRTLTAPLIHGRQFTLFRTPAMAAEVRDTWQTPEFVADICREGLGGKIHLDPASCYEANKRVKAEYFYNEERNGLSLPWFGAVFLNPPYGGKEEIGADVFTAYLIEQIDVGNVTKAITVLNLQSVPTRWFPRVRKHASAHAIWNKRIPFIGPVCKSGKGTRYGASKNGTIFSFFGEDHSNFVRAFRGHAMIVTEI